jgi:ferredoxin
MDTLTRRDRIRIESYRKIGEDVLLGKVAVDREKCTGCGFCTHACPAGALEVADKKARMVGQEAFCFSCGDCVAICPEKAIELTDFIKFKRFFRYLDRGDPEAPRRF